MSNKNSKSLILNEIKLHYNFRSNIEFASFLGIAPQTLSSWYSRNSIDYDLVSAKCVDISGDWLITGEGSMLKNTNNITATESPHEIGECQNCKFKDQIIDSQTKQIKALEKVIEVQEDSIQSLKKLCDYPEDCAKKGDKAG